MIRRYTREDKEKVLALLQLNTPEFFDLTEEKDLADYLENLSQNYFVVEDQGMIIGAGGFNLGFDKGRLARISWDIIHPDFQGRGIGKELTLYQINEIKKNTSVKKVVVRTTQLSYLFYQKLGFRLEKSEKDFWAKGFDLYQLEMEIK